MLNCDCVPALAAGLKLEGRRENQEDDRGGDDVGTGGDPGMIFGSGKGKRLLLGFGGGGDDETPQRKFKGVKKKGQAFAEPLAVIRRKETARRFHSIGQ